MYYTSDLTENTYSKNNVAKCSPDFSPWLNTTLHSIWLLFFFPFTWHTEPKLTCWLLISRRANGSREQCSKAVASVYVKHNSQLDNVPNFHFQLHYRTVLQYWRNVSDTRITNTCNISRTCTLPSWPSNISHISVIISWGCNSWSLRVRHCEHQR
jgi:hypothetical protein